MAKNHFYAVKVGRETGLFKSWDECKKQVDGFPGCQYKGFPTEKKALEYLNGVSDDTSVPKAEITIYVDGSYDADKNVYGYGVVALDQEGNVMVYNKAGCNVSSTRLRNVAGELLGAMYAVKYAMCKGYKSVEICYDYFGIEKWVTGEWKAKNELTALYSAYMNEWKNEIEILFTKVAAHTNVKYNELADRLAKQAVMEF